MTRRKFPGSFAGIAVCIAGVALLAGTLATAGPTSAAESDTGPDTAAEAAPLMMIPQPTQVALDGEIPPTGSWAPDATTRILVTDETLASEASRLSQELAALDIVDAPELLLESEPFDHATAADIVLTADAERPTILATQAGLQVSGTDASGVFRATRPLLQQLAATGSVPAGQFEFTLPDDQIRAVHIDIARKHYPIESLEALLFDMSWYGFNELELHFSENEGFAIESLTHPDIASPDAHSQAEIAALIELANSLHIRVTPSLDMPGHLDYALETYPELRLRDPAGSAVFGALDITNPDALAFANDLIGEYATLFAQPDVKGPVPWHLGGDEFVDFGDHYEVAALTELAQNDFGPDAVAYDALTSFVNDIAATVREAGFQPRVFSDGMLRATTVELDHDIEVAYWTQRPPGAVPASEFAAQGYPLVNLNDEFLYFVLGERVEYYYPTGDAILEDWNDTVYPSVDGAPEVIEDSLGGVFAIWSDIPDALTADGVVEAVRAPIAAMAVKFAMPETTMPFGYLETILAASGRPPAIVATDPGSLPNLTPDMATPPATSSGTDDETGGGYLSQFGSVSQWMWWVGGAVLVALATLVTTVVVRRKRRPRG